MGRVNANSDAVMDEINFGRGKMLDNPVVLKRSYIQTDLVF